MVWQRRRWIGTMDELLVMEQWFAEGDDLVSRYDDALAALAHTDVEVWLADAVRAGVQVQSAQHFRGDWLNGTAIPGVERDAIEAALRDGFTAAITDGRDTELPMSIVWVMLGEGPRAFDVNHIVGANAVTVVISVPVGTKGAPSDNTD